MNPATETRPTTGGTRLRPPLLLPQQKLVLTNSRYAVHLSSVGSGYSECDGIAISRAGADKTRDADGFHIYLHDLDDGAVWSAGYQPTRVEPLQYDFREDGSTAEIVRVDGDVECRLTVCVSPHDDLELRRVQLTNHGVRTRRIVVTSYLEWVLTSREADASHPAFSKLFVETQFLRDHATILARRRPRNSDESEFWGFHAVVQDSAGEVDRELQFETNRARFIGRGRSLARPQALDHGAVLTGDMGPVLDPIASLRVPLVLGAGDSRSLVFALGCSRDRAEINDLLPIRGDVAQLDRLLPAALGLGSLEANGELAVAGPPGTDGKRRFFDPPHCLSVPQPESQARFAKDGVGRESMKRVAVAGGDTLQYENGYGGFSPDGREYVITIQPDDRGEQIRPPLPWVNVVANEQAGFLITESGAGYTWAGNSRENRLTAWHNDPIIDPHGEALWIRDEEDGSFWSPTPGPTPAAAAYQVRHGFGYTTFEHESHQLSQEVTMFVPRDEPVKLTRLRLTNRSGRTRRLSLFSYVHWALGARMDEAAEAITTTQDDQRRVIWATNPHREHYGRHTAFSAVRFDESAGFGRVSLTCDRTAFLGRYGDTDGPAALVRDSRLDGRTGNGFDPCAAWQLTIDLPPNGTFECTYLLGETADKLTANDLISKYADAAQVERALLDVKEFWRETISAIAIETPDREIDLMVNGWLAYQNLSCRMWGRSAYYQPGGAFGFRDQLQDSAALVYHRPDITRAQILRHAAQQFVEGDVLHWWHPDSGYGLRTRFSDDLLWLPFVTAEYVRTTGDEAILDEELPFLTAAPLNEGQQEAFLCPAPAGIHGTLYEHCCRALDRGLTSGGHGLPLIGCGDWNDGFSRVGRLGRGESVWLGFFIECVLQRMLPICEQRGDDERVERYSAYRERLREALNTAGWDGAWYRRAYYDNGQPIGSTESDECQIDALAQSWAVISGVAPPDRAKAAIEAAESRLVDDRAGIIRLLTPAFDLTPNDAGYIKGYVPGIRENGGQYTHGVLWLVRAVAELGRGTRAVELLRMLSPVCHTSTRQATDLYQTEPYVVAADVYGEPPHVGRGGWTWYTGSAGWMLRVAVESIFGFSIDRGQTLVINPSISSKWSQCRLKYRLPDGQTRYEITIENPSGKERGVREAAVDGVPAAIEAGAARVPLSRDGKLHRVVVRL